jgi:hypothetical protein
MRIRAVTADGDLVFGRGAANYLVDSMAAVGLAINERLELFLGQWYLNLTAGTPWLTDVIGYGTQGIYDQMLQGVIAGTQGVQAILSYSGSLDRTRRALSVSAVVLTIYGPVPLVLNPIINTFGFGYNMGGDFGN